MPTRVTELSIDELRALVEEAVRRVLRESETEGHAASKAKRAPLNIPVLDVGPWPEGLALISREDMYGDDGR